MPKPMYISEAVSAPRNRGLGNVVPHVWETLRFGSARPVPQNGNSPKAPPNHGPGRINDLASIRSPSRIFGALISECDLSWFSSGLPPLREGKLVEITQEKRLGVDAPAECQRAPVRRKSRIEIADGLLRWRSQSPLFTGVDG